VLLEGDAGAGDYLLAARPRAIPPRVALGATAPNVLGHLTHHVQLQRPEELWVVLCEVQLRRLVELLLGIADEERPALASRDPSVLCD
jgi:hypothetical protein